MGEMLVKDERYVNAQKKVKDMIGFYVHLFVTIFIIPFIVIINLDLAPQFRWFWFFIGAWFIGLLIHWMNVFGFSKKTLKREWKENKISELVGDDELDKNSDHARELFYISAKKDAKNIKGFYAHLIVSLISTVLIIWVNLEYVPGFHFFWYAAIGMALAVFFHWMGVFGFPMLGFNKAWEERKIKEIIDNK